MNNKFSTVIYTLTFASFGASVIATKFFSDYSNSLATSLTIGTVALGITSVVTVFGELRKAEACAADRDMDARFDQIWRELRDQRREIEDRIDGCERQCHNRMDNEVEAIHTRFDNEFLMSNAGIDDARFCGASVSGSKNYKKKA